MGNSQGIDFLHGVATDRISHVLLCILEPGVEGRSFLGEGEVKLLNLPELVLHLQQTLLPARAVRKKLIPPGDHHRELFIDRLGLNVVALDQLVLQCRDVLDALRLEGAQPDVECLLLGQQRLDTKENSTVQ